MHDRAAPEPTPQEGNLLNRHGWIVSGLVILGGVYLTSLYSFLLFHSLVELFSVVVAAGIFIVAWNCRRLMDNNYLLFLGIAYLFVAAVDTVHTLAYKGMGVFTGFDANLPTQLWIFARYLESLSLLVAPFFLRRRLDVNIQFSVYAAVLALGFGAIFYWSVFPDCFVEGKGLTPFKKISEYTISLILFGSLALLVRNRARFGRKVFVWLAWSVITTVVSEIAFTFYVSVYGLSNLVGHIFKLLSFYMLYKAILETGLTRPFALLWRNLMETQETLKEEKDRAQGYLDVAGVTLLVLGPDGKVRLINRRGCEILGYEQEEIVGTDWIESFIPARVKGEVKEVFSGLLSGEVDRFECFENPVLTKDGQERIIAWRNSLLKSPEGKVIEILSSGEDITDRKRTEEERERLLRGLQDALSQVRALRGMLPICSACKKVRDDKGYWTQIEAYVREHAGVEFTHGLCPECKKRLYPEFLEGEHGEAAERKR